MTKINQHTNPDHTGPDNAAGNLKIAFFLNLAFTLLEVAGGLWTNSIAILSDALHDAGDCASLGVAWYLQRLSGKASDSSFTYGYGRFSVLGALITSIVLLVGLAFILWKAIPRLLNPEEVNAPIMIALAAVGIAVNGAAALKLRGAETLNENVVGWHLLEDVLGWVAVLIGSLAMTIWGYPIIDPILSVLISLFVLWNVVKQLKHVLLVFLQRAPESFDLRQFEHQVQTMPRVVSNHHTHSWSIDGASHVLSTHIVIQDDATREDIVQTKDRVRKLLKEHPFEHITIEIELEGEDCPERSNEDSRRQATSSSSSSDSPTR